MGTKEKLIERFLSQPSDFTYSEVVRLFGIFNYTERQKGATSGSRVEFVSADGKRSFIMHKPHPSNIIKRYAMRQIMTYLIDNTNLKSMKQ
ncbi:MAG TPA: type II toxin-antitoxin system HicA family toxin [Candidatus Coprenecus stercoravium]|uniref:Type II toxin-antitoxin system HicA family toxin n=1 Tax=Candidatus Coprenecus stercoravium TaxID=2840735 RepID=A0A9D2GQZ2_9BACT|nr:type II toxin-antitoxin system HicA family toxin [Candidatus Coprenecus stercoravium]